MARRKNTRRIDPRWFMNEKTDIIKEGAVPHSAHHVVNKMRETGLSAKEALKSFTDPELSDEEAENWLKRNKDEMDAAEKSSTTKNEAAYEPGRAVSGVEASMFSADVRKIMNAIEYDVEDLSDEGMNPDQIFNNLMSTRPDLHNKDVDDIKRAIRKLLQLGPQEFEDETGQARLEEVWRRYLTETIGLDDNPDLSQDGFKTAKKPIPLQFRYAKGDGWIKTKEGEVRMKAGDAIMTGTEGENWPIPAEKFAETYDDLGDGTAAKKNIPVFAKEMDQPFQVKVSWSNDLLQGEPGDYLVQYGPGDYGVVGREIFAKTYKM